MILSSCLLPPRGGEAACEETQLPGLGSGANREGLFLRGQQLREAALLERSLEKMEQPLESEGKRVAWTGNGGYGGLAIAWEG